MSFENVNRNKSGVNCVKWAQNRHSFLLVNHLIHSSMSRASQTVHLYGALKMCPRHLVQCNLVQGNLTQRTFVQGNLTQWKFDPRKGEITEIWPKKIDPMANETQRKFVPMKFVQRKICLTEIWPSGKWTQRKFVPRKIWPKEILSQRKFDPIKFDPGKGSPTETWLKSEG